MRDRAETGEAVKEAELEKIADAEVGDGAEVAREFVVLRLASVCLDNRLHACNSLFRLTLSITRVLFLALSQSICTHLRQNVTHNGTRCDRKSHFS